MEHDREPGMVEAGMESDSEWIWEMRNERRQEPFSSGVKAQGVSYGQIRSIQGVGSSQPVPGHENNVKDAANRRVDVYLYASEAMIKKAEAGTLN